MRIRVEMQLRYDGINKSEWLLKTVTMPYPLPVGSRYHAEPDRKDIEYDDRAWEVLHLLWHEQDENYYLHIGSTTKKFSAQMAELLKHYKNHGWKRVGEDD